VDRLGARPSWADIARETRHVRCLENVVGMNEMKALTSASLATVAAAAAISLAACTAFGADDGTLPGDDAGVVQQGGDAATDSALPSSGRGRSETYQELVRNDQAIAFWRLANPECATTTCVSEIAPGTSDGTPPPGVFLEEGLFGPASRASRFGDAVQSAIVMPGVLLSPKSFTIELWFRPSKAPDGAYRALAVHTVGSAATPDGFVLYYEHTNGIGFERRMAATRKKRTAVSPAPAVGVWHHIVAVYEDAPSVDVALFVDGVKAGQSFEQPSDPHDPTPFAIGAKPNGKDVALGSIAEIALYASALGPSSIAEHYTAGRPGD
jgi:hypothetical protein